MDKVTKKYSNGEITIIWKPELCVHATTCFRELPDVFKPYHRPWIDPNAATTQQIIDVVSKCPTQALAYEWNKKSTNENIQNKSEENLTKAEKHPATEITLLDSGPILIKGNFVLRDQNGISISAANIVSLCRCGRSNRKPFCDGSHNNIS